MPYYNPTWVTLCNKLSQVQKSLSVAKREKHLLAQLNTRLREENIRLREDNIRLLKENKGWVKSYNDLAASNSEQLILYNSLLERSKPDDCEGTSA